MTCGIATLVMELVKIEVKNADNAAAVASQRALVEKAGTSMGAVAVVNGKLERKGQQQ